MADPALGHGRLRAFWGIVAVASVMGGCGSCVKEEEPADLPKANVGSPIDAQAVGVVGPLRPGLKGHVVKPDDAEAKPAHP